MKGLLNSSRTDLFIGRKEKSKRKKERKMKMMRKRIKESTRKRKITNRDSTSRKKARSGSMRMLTKNTWEEIGGTTMRKCM